MPRYVNSANSYFFREIGRKASANEVIDLPEEAYEKYKKSHPGLLRPALLNTMAEVPMVRAKAVKAPVETPEETAVEPAAPAEKPAPKKRGRAKKN